MNELEKKINIIEIDLKREINYNIYSKDEVVKQLKNENDFIVKIFNDDKKVLKGNLNDIARFD